MTTTAAIGCISEPAGVYLRDIADFCSGRTAVKDSSAPVHGSLGPFPASEDATEQDVDRRGAILNRIKPR